MRACLSPKWFMGKRLCPGCRAFIWAFIWSFIWVNRLAACCSSQHIKYYVDHASVIITLSNLVTPFGTYLRKKTVPPLQPFCPNSNSRLVLPRLLSCLSSGGATRPRGFSVSKRFSTFEESPQTTLGTFWWSRLWTSSPHAVSRPFSHSSYSGFFRWFARHSDFFSKVDLVHGYHQVPVQAEGVPKTAVITPFRFFEFLRMPFGQKGAAQMFQRLMDSFFSI